MRKLLVLSALSILILAGRASAEVDFTKDVKPILEQTCVRCHGPEKPKGDLRLDTRAGLLKGSKSSDKIVVPGKADDSRLYEVITLPKDDPARMPNEGDPLSKAQIEVFRNWINEGLKWPEGLILKASDTAPVGTVTDPGVPITEAEKAAVAKLQKSGVLVLRLAQNTNLLRADFSHRGKDFKEEELAMLKDLANLAELSLAGTAVTDKGLEYVKGAARLEKLQIQNTKVTDAGLENLKGLQKLVSLNLYGTATVTDKGLEHLKGLKNLQNLYLWETKATKPGAQKLADALANPKLKINLGPDGDVTAAKPPEKEKPPEKDKEKK